MKRNFQDENSISSWQISLINFIDNCNLESTQDKRFNEVIGNVSKKSKGEFNFPMILKRVILANESSCPVISVQEQIVLLKENRQYYSRNDFIRVCTSLREKGKKSFALDYIWQFHLTDLMSIRYLFHTLF
jgi:hypothetical protein